MTVTEFGVTKGSGETFTPELRSAIEAALTSQTKWLKIDPAATGVNPITGDRVWLLQQIEDPASVLMAATWTTVEQHTEWATTDPDRDTLLPAIGKHLYQPKGDDDPAKPVILVHTEGDVFKGEPTPKGKRALLDSPVISVTRMYVTAGKKAEFEKAFNDTKGLIEAYTSPNIVRGSWRVDKEKDAATGEDKEEFVLVAGWESREAHYAIADTDVGPKLAAFTSLLDDRDSKHYKRLL